jgi:hypothetical protein
VIKFLNEKHLSYVPLQSMPPLRVRGRRGRERLRERVWVKRVRKNERDRGWFRE